MLAKLDINRAAAEGPACFRWWPDWRGKACAIVASGPSTKSAGIEKLRGRLPVIAIKENAYDLCSWADVAYGCDLAWWKHRRGLQTFKGLKIGWDKSLPQFFPDVKTITIKKTKEHPVQYSDEMHFDEPGVIGGGGNSGFQAANLAAQFGADRILGIGFDMYGDHWYGRNNWMKGNNPVETNFRTWRRAFENAADTFKHMGIEFVNASPNSTLKCFRKASVDQALAEWGL